MRAPIVRTSRVWFRESASIGARDQAATASQRRAASPARKKRSLRPEPHPLRIQQIGSRKVQLLKLFSAQVWMGDNNNDIILTRRSRSGGRCSESFRTF